MCAFQSREELTLLERALHAARDTRVLVVEPGGRHAAARVFASAFGDQPAVIVADERTFAAAGGDVLESFRRADAACEEPFLFGPDVHAEHSFVGDEGNRHVRLRARSARSSRS